MKIQRTLNIIAILCLFSVGFALFSQYQLNMQPCAWCVLQRFIFLLIAIICLIANVFYRPLILRFFAFLSFSFSILGMLSAWYQYSVAANLFSCDMTFADIFISEWTQLDAKMPWLFGVYASCMQAKVSLFGIEYALWGLGLFALLALLSLYAIFSPQKREFFH